MDERQLYALAADALLFAHALFVAFVVLGLAFVLVGGPLGWSWVRNLWLRLTHLLAIGVVVIQSWLGLVCPLTTWEMALRGRAGGAVYTGSFVSHWVSEILYYRAPDWVFAVVYSVFGALVVAAWVWVTPRPLRRTGKASRRPSRRVDQASSPIHSRSIHSARSDQLSSDEQSCDQKTTPPEASRQ